MKNFDVIIIGAGAAGLMCAMTAGKRGKKVLVLEGSNKPGKKILMSGGGRCNFTNYNVSHECYISHNPHFCKSALKCYTQWDFIKLVEEHKIPYHEKTLGQLFCDNKSSDIVNMLLSECKKYNVKIKLNCNIEKIDENYKIQTDGDSFSCNSLVVACGGLSIPTMGASPLGYKIAEQFGIKVWPTRAGLVPLTLHVQDKTYFSELSGVSLYSSVSVNNKTKTEFSEELLFTHRGLSGPAILQISSYWEPGEKININTLPNKDIYKILVQAKENKVQKQLNSMLANYLPKRVVEKLIPVNLSQKKCCELTNKEITEVVNLVVCLQIQPNGTEGYRTAEVTLGGVDCDSISSKTFESFSHKGLFFIGEVLDVTGWLGGYNFQWAWSSGAAAGHFV